MVAALLPKTNPVSGAIIQSGIEKSYVRLSTEQLTLNESCF